MKLAAALLVLTIRLAGQAANPTVTAVTNFGGATRFSPAAFAFAFGTNLGTDGKIFIGGTQCQTFYVSDTLVSFQIPGGTPVGPATLTLQSSNGTSAPVSLTISPTSPVVVLNNAKPPITYFFNITSAFIPLPTPSPGDRAYLYIDGVGAARPPVPPEVQIDGNDVPVLSSTTFQALIGPSGNNLGSVPAFFIQIPTTLAGGPHSLHAIAGGVTSADIQFTVIVRGLFTSQTGLTFNAVQNGPAIPNQSFSVLSGSGTANFSLAASTVSGGGWLSANPTAGAAISGTAGVPIQVQANPSGLALGAYYGQITITSPDVPNSPQIVTIVLNVSAKVGTSIDKTGAIFIGATGGSDPAPQTINAFNPSNTGVAFSSTIQGAGAGLFKITPSTGTIPGGKTQAISIQPAIKNIPTGVNAAKLVLSFSDGTVRNVSLLLIVAPGAGSLSSANVGHAGSACVPSKLLPVFTLLGDSFNVPAAWPSPVEALILDDCGTPLTKGDVILTFSNGDPPLRLDPTQPGYWDATWPPGNARSSVTLTLTAAQLESNLSGTAQISGAVAANPAVPEVSAGGVVETAAYGSPVAPGDLVAIFGAQMSTGTASATAVPLPTQLLTTSVLIDGQYIPMFFTSDGQVNAVVPYGLSTNVRHQLVLQRDNSLSVPQSVLIAPARPGVFTIDSSGSGQGHIYKIDSAGRQILANANAPAKAGDTLVIYCSGLGAVTPALNAGSPTPLAFLTQTTGTLTAKVGGMPAAVNFAGLTPGSTGLYQVNLVVPSGLPNNDATSLVLTISGQDSSTVTFSVHQ